MTKYPVAEEVESILKDIEVPEGVVADVGNIVSRLEDKVSFNEAIRNQFCKLLGFAEFYSWEAIYDQVKLMKKATEATHDES